MSTQLRTILTFSGLALALASCSFDLDPDKELFTCESDADCGDGWVCVRPYDNIEQEYLAPRCAPDSRNLCVPDVGSCNGKDDDCDGEIDEADEIGEELQEAIVEELKKDDGRVYYHVDQGANCHLADPLIYGVCKEGVLRCVREEIVCVAVGTEPGDIVDDTCNGFDEDCNDLADDLFPNKDTDNQNCGECGNVCAVESGQTCVNGNCVETACADGEDNDGDSLIDCSDPDCNGLSCGLGGVVCKDGRCPMRCGDEPDGEITCFDGRDNDCNGVSDCRDPRCNGKICDSIGSACGKSGTQPACLPQESDCGNGKDDDGDGNIDCDDDGCNARSCGDGMNCGFVGSNMPECLPIESICHDGNDDDGDGTTDCEDDDCLGMECQAGMANRNCGTTAGQRSCVAREVLCTNAEDDDGDSFVDCEDSDCDGAICGDGCFCEDGFAKETICGDGLDNNGSGFLDCGDLVSCLDEPCGDGCVCVQIGSRGFPKELICNDGLNNDRDRNISGVELVDCQDPDCAGVDCSVDGGPPCTCSDCPGGVCPQGEGDGLNTCHDEIDNDGDQLADCEDPDCDERRCLDRDGCLCRSAKPTEVNCLDGQDNDQDGETDCADPDCDTQLCSIQGGCRCGEGIKTESGCFDGNDNDGDGVTDCNDPDCHGLRCSDDGGCVCTYDQGNGTGRKAEAVCTDGKDNDGDAATDCDDADCDSLSCGDGCVCDITKPQGKRKREIWCYDGKNNDSNVDQQIDCEDLDCEGLGCGSGVDQIERDDCICKNGLPAEVDCANGEDDDGDLAIDCDDDSCIGVVPCPQVISTAPDNGPATGGHRVVITGKNFGYDEDGNQTNGIDAIRFGGAACLNAEWVSESEVVCGSTPNRAVGRTDVEVENPGAFKGSKLEAYVYTSHQLHGLDNCEFSPNEYTTSPGADLLVVGRVDEDGKTNGQVSDSILGEVGWGPDGTDPRSNDGWTWTRTTVDVAGDGAQGDWDRHTATIVAPADKKDYAMTIRFSQDGGIRWLYCDASAVEGFQTGKLTVQ